MVKITTGDFIKSITCDNTGLAISQCFDEIMVLYYLLSGKENIKISTNIDSKPPSFILTTESEEAALKLQNTMNGLDFSVYGEKYIIIMKSNSNTVHTIIEKASS